MGRDNKLVYAKAAARTVTKALRDQRPGRGDRFDSQPFVIVPLQPLKDTRPYFDEMIERLKARGTTFLLPALKEAERTLAGSGASIKHVVILTDGETGGTADQYYDLVSSMHHDGGASISTIAVGRQAESPAAGLDQQVWRRSVVPDRQRVRPAGDFSRRRETARRRADDGREPVRARAATLRIRC